ncbi:acyltransferase family protein [Paenibacillus silviterrae]|uniref:acyltransferase family protein n=1 Tax=Paenibacillus silviterrae TaxID=3242194 RepID=UPI002542F568|nr:acyltransferase [Paenibacillus chinjuensis]
MAYFFERSKYDASMKTIKGFNGLRAISVLLVIASHGGWFQALSITNPVIRGILSADVGVQIFFVLSGFLITRLLLKEHKEYGNINIRNFFIRRILRIFPLYFLALSVVPIMESQGKIAVKGCVYEHAYFFLYNFTPQGCELNAYSHFWSLAVEEHFYLIWPLIFLFNKRVAFFLVTLFAIVASIFGLSLWPDLLSAYNSGRWTYPAAAPIAFGCIAAYLVTSERFCHWVSTRLFRIILLVFSVATFIANVFGEPRFIFYLGITCLVLYVYFSQDSHVIKVLEFQPLAYIGQISFGLYVWQGILAGNGSYREYPDYPLPLGEGIALTFLLAPLSYHFFEKPILRLKKYFESSRGTSLPNELGRNKPLA